MTCNAVARTAAGAGDGRQAVVDFAVAVVVRAVARFDGGLASRQGTIDERPRRNVDTGERGRIVRGIDHGRADGITVVGWFGALRVEPCPPARRQ